MSSNYHPISLSLDKCIGCTNCIKRCPTQAIRVKNEKAKIIQDKCINCGMCISVCPYNAFRGVVKGFKGVSQFPVKVALVDPIVYGQFNTDIMPEQILGAIRACGCSDIYEVSRGSDLITAFTKKYLALQKKTPVISSSCPAIIRLIQLRFPELIHHILPIDSPVEVSAYLARQEAMRKYGLRQQDIGIYYFTPCPARIASFINPVGTKASYVDMAIPIKSLYININQRLKDSSPKTANVNFYPSGKGIEWARVGGQCKALEIEEYLAVDGIENVINLLEEMEYGKIKNLKFLECQACNNGCVGGSLNVENSYIAKNRIRNLGSRYTAFEPGPFPVPAEQFIFTEPINPLHATKLDKDLSRALLKLEQVENTLEELPGIDCGACGAPSCRAFAEDIVLGYAKKSECVVLLKQRMHE
jgi:iron only hydrogenase large subunit-like protein